MSCYQNLDVAEAFRVFTGGATVTVASVSKEGVSDVMTAAWNCPFDSSEIIVVLSTTHTTTENIYNTEKFKLKVIPNCLAYFECELVDKDLLEKKGICLGRVVNLYVKEGLWNQSEHNFSNGAKLSLHHVTEDKFLSGGTEAK